MLFNSKQREEPYPLLTSWSGLSEMIVFGSAGNYKGTAGNKPEEGGDDVKSSWPLRVGLHTCYNGRYKRSLKRELELIPKSLPQSGLESATRLHEAGIASNRESECHGEYVLGPCTHRPSRHGSVLHQKWFA